MDRPTGTGQDALVLSGAWEASAAMRTPGGAMISRQCAQLRTSEADPQFWHGQGPARDLRERRPEAERERRLGMNVVATASPAWSRWEMSNGMRRHSIRSWDRSRCAGSSPAPFSVLYHEPG